MKGRIYAVLSPGFIHSYPLFLKAGAFFAHSRKSTEWFLQAAVIIESPKRLCRAESGYYRRPNAF
jgi:hypothetical protein